MLAAAGAAAADTEQAVDDIARHLQLDPLEVRKRNLYREGRDTTHYGQTITHHVLPELISQLETSADYQARRAEITTPRCVWPRGSYTTTRLAVWKATSPDGRKYRLPRERSPWYPYTNCSSSWPLLGTPRPTHLGAS